MTGNRGWGRDAAKFGLPLSPAANLPDLEAYYYAKCEEYGTTGFCAMPAWTPRRGLAGAATADGRMRRELSRGESRVAWRLDDRTTTVLSHQLCFTPAARRYAHAQ